MDHWVPSGWINGGGVLWLYKRETLYVDARNVNEGTTTPGPSPGRGGDRFVPEMGGKWVVQVELIE